MRVHRLISILMMVEQAHKIKANQLAKNLEVSTRTIYRDIDILCEAGFPLYTTTGPGGGIQFMDGYSIGLSVDSDSSSNAIDLLPTLMNSIAVIPDKVTTAQSIEAGFQQLQEVLKGKSTQNSQLSDKIMIDHDTWWGEDSDPFDIRLLIDALWSLTSLKITYQKLDGTSSIRLINPYGLILKHTNWYMVAYCHTADAIRTFRCERILSSESTTRPYKISMTFNLKEHWTNSVKQFATSKEIEDDYLVKLEIPATYADKLAERSPAWNGKSGNTYVATLNMHNFTLAKEELLDMIGYVKVIQPPELADYAIECLKSQLKNAHATI